MPCGFEITKREVFLVILIGVAYLAPSNFRDEIFERAFPGMAQKKYASSAKDEAGVGGKLTQAEKANEDHRGWKTPLPKPTPLGLYKNQNEVVHVIHTRYMLFQQHLTSLGRARMELFKTFTLPSILKQSEREFLWIIWMEPQLEAELRKDFIALVKDIPNCVVIGSREKMPFIRSEYYEEVMESSIYSGSYDLLMDYHEASLSRIVLQTTLDADDAVFYDFTRSVQRDAVKTLKHSTLKYDFRIWCARKRLEWGYYNPWDEDSQVGFLMGYESKKECPPGGYTKGYGVVTDTTDLPEQGRFEIHTKTPQCEFVEHKCIARIYGGASEYAVLKSRTPTAHGMTDVMPKTNSKKQDSWKDRQDEVWKKLPKNFGVNISAVHEARAVLEEDMVDIILQNLEGQCKEGFSCKHSTKEHLKELKAKYKKQQDEQKQMEIDQLQEDPDGRKSFNDDEDVTEKENNPDVKDESEVNSDILDGEETEPDQAEEEMSSDDGGD
eukprot:CAMPEP_0172465852 /NCGR_PEP_ID=MMETSP1065-20121228/54641_1 /TAXON_ID=265537 /ORGANISM="Amphiprora paludosa, Strain CCMP125" /LENGTH=494 /DNA_ID=CAMNT_0013222501 /DNA_START=87 /DNA_END=1571 /DNA_ORIENTATION=+